MQLLLVEDNPDDAQLALRALAQVVALEHVRHVDRGLGAIEVLHEAIGASHPPRVVFLDLMLPQLDGFSVLGRLKAEERTRAIPVVILSSSSLERDIRECYRLGANSYIAKPVGFDAYLAAVVQAARYWIRGNLTVG